MGCLEATFVKFWGMDLTPMGAPQKADMTSTAVPMASLVNVLSRQMERVVTDKTGLTGRYDLNLAWSRDDGGTAANDPASPSIVTALEEQLGLRLRAAKLPVETLVVDHVALPAGN